MRKIRQFQAHDRYRRKIQQFNNDTTKTTNRYNRDNKIATEIKLRQLQNQDYADTNSTINKTD